MWGVGPTSWSDYFYWSEVSWWCRSGEVDSLAVQGRGCVVEGDSDGEWRSVHLWYVKRTCKTGKPPGDRKEK